MAKTKTTYVSADGKEFDTELEADARDQFLSMQASIEAYITAAGLMKAQAGLMRKHLSGYAAFMANGFVPAEIVESVEDVTGSTDAVAEEAAPEAAAEAAPEAAVEEAPRRRRG